MSVEASLGKLYWGQEGKYDKGNKSVAAGKASCKKAGIKKKIGVHSLRHTFATHLLESGTDLRYIQSLLSHESSKTTEIYTHITTKGFDQIKNPLDQLDLQKISILVDRIIKAFQISAMFKLY